MHGAAAANARVGGPSWQLKGSRDCANVGWCVPVGDAARTWHLATTKWTRTWPTRPGSREPRSRGALRVRGSETTCFWGPWARERGGKRKRPPGTGRPMCGGGRGPSDVAKVHPGLPPWPGRVFSPRPGTPPPPLEELRAGKLGGRRLGRAHNWWGAGPATRLVGRTGLSPRRTHCGRLDCTTPRSGSPTTIPPPPSSSVFVGNPPLSLGQTQSQRPGASPGPPCAAAGYGLLRVPLERARLGP